MTGRIGWKIRGRGPALVFLHGIGGGAESFDAQLQAFGDDWLAAAWDMPGYGASPPCDQPGFDAWTEALAAGLDDLGVAECVLVGHSIGGMVAQTFVSRYPNRVRALVLSATSPAFGNPDGDFQRDFIASRLGPLDNGAGMAELAATFVPGLVGRAAPAPAMDAARAMMARVPPATYRAAMQALVRFDARASLPGIACPCLLLAGEDDTSAPPRVMERMASKIADSDFVCIPAMGHLGSLEQPEAFNAALAGFLAARSLAGNPDE